MIICDICKTNTAGYNDYAVIKDDGTTKKLELCGRCGMHLVGKGELICHTLKI
jgi:hypothetical protein